MSDLEEMGRPDLLGEARPLFKSCTITLRKNQSYLNYRETVLHEYLHCMGYSHVPNKMDLMYFKLNPIDKEHNIRQYAKEVLKKFYE